MARPMSMAMRCGLDLIPGPSECGPEPTFRVTGAAEDDAGVSGPLFFLAFRRSSYASPGVSGGLVEPARTPVPDSSTVLQRPPKSFLQSPVVSHGDVPQAVIRQLALMYVGRFAVLPILVVEHGYCVPDREAFDGEHWGGICEHCCAPMVQPSTIRFLRGVERLFVSMRLAKVHDALK